MAIRKGGFIDFRAFYPKAQLQGTAGTNLLTAAQTQTAADTTHDVYDINGTPVTIYHGAAATAFTPAAGVTGWGLPVDATDNEGCILTIGNGLSNAALPWCFTVGTDVPFYMRWTGISATVLVADALANAAFFMGGFMTAGAYSANNAIAEMTTQALMTSDANATPFADVAALSCSFVATAAVYSCFKTNSAAGANTDTTLVEANGVAWTYELRVSATGVVTGYRNGTLLTTPASGIVGTLANAVVVQPRIVFVNGATTTASGAAIVTSVGWGLQ